MTEISKQYGPSAQIIEQRPQLVRSIFLSQSGLPWLRQALADAMHLQSIVKPRWLNRSELLPYQASILSDPKGRFIRVVEYLQDGRAAFICTPEGYHCSGWSTFQQYIIHYFGHKIPSALPRRNREFYHQKALPPPPQPLPKADNPHHQPTSFPTNHTPKHHPKPKPWDNPKDYINLFANYISHSDMMSVPSFRDGGWLLFVTGHTIT